MLSLLFCKRFRVELSRPVMVLSGVLLLAAVSTAMHHLDAVYIEECSPGKYYWKEEEPGEFYACVESTRGINPSIPNYVTNAIKMKCTEGTYMCSVPNDPFFKPCSCKTDADDGHDDQIALSGADAAGKGSSSSGGRSNKAVTAAPASAANDGGLRQAGKRGLTGPREKIDQQSSADKFPPHSNQRQQKDPEVADDQEVETAGPKDHHQPQSPRRHHEQVSDLFGVSTLPPPVKSRSRQSKLQPFAKQLSAVSTRTFPSLPSEGCPDLYRRYPNSHMFQGVMKQHTTLIDCQNGCLEERNCLGVDWIKIDSPAGDAADSRRCYFIFPESTRYGFQPSKDYCCDHFRRTYCMSTLVPTNGENTTPSYKEPYEGDGADVGAAAAATSGDSNTVPLSAADGHSSSSRKSDVRGAGASRSSDANSATAAQAAAATDSEVDFNVNDLQDPGAPIPDTGCPYTFQKFVGRSHPFGKNVTRGTQNNSAEKCKHWCLVRSYCYGVDFSTQTSTCYFLREVNTALLVSATGVTHYQKTDCAPPLKCWKTNAQAIASPADARVTDARMPSIDCPGQCFVRQTIGVTNVIERGCDTSKSGVNSVGCFVEGTPNSNFRTISCYCDTNRCNGLSVEALVSQMLYLPLDGDLRDHSGVQRNGGVPAGQSSPSFTCLDKAVNCSALFMSGQCVTVNSLAQVPYVSSEVQGRTIAQVPKASFVVFYKRVPNGTPRKQGVFGNTAISATKPTWAIYADNLTDTATAGVITDGTALPNVEDFKYSIATDNRWHQHVLTYNGKNSPLPTLQYFVDGVEMVGNSRLESGMISVRDQPVSIGCVEGLNFVGFIDEARIFSTSIDKLDIEALLLMQDLNY